MVSRRDLLAGSASAFAMLALPARAASGGRVYRVPISLASRRLLVSCTIEGQGPFALGIDTGGVTSVIQLDLAKRLGLKQRGVTPLGLAGRYDRYPMFEAREVIFGNTFRQESVLLAGTQGAGFGSGVVGMLAAGCLTTMDSELEFAAMEWRLFPDGGPPRTGWVAHEGAIRPTRVGSPHLFGRAALGGKSLRCLFDTGAPGTLLLFTKAARQAGIDVDGQNWSPAITNGKQARLYRSRQPLAIGGLAIDRPLVRVTDNLPNFVDDGIVGLPTIQRLNLATDVDAGRLWTRPSGLPAGPVDYNMSGLWIDQKGREIVAGRIGKGSPAEQAGIAPGDRIEGYGFGEMIARLGGPPDSMVGLRVSRQGAVRDVTLVLRDYL
jgi:hypothetical protein